MKFPKLKFSTIRTFQLYHQRWLDHNFPEQTGHQALLGMVEEIGELAHAHLKYEQGIRGIDRDEFVRQAEDAIGDLFIYAASYCNTNNLDLANCFEVAWGEVSLRDWQEFPTDGRTS